MARYSFNRGGSVDSSSTNRIPTENPYISQPTGEVLDAPNDNSDFSGSVASKVKDSIAYKNAYQLFAQESDSSWLQRLVAIPTSVEDASKTWIDQIGLSNNYADKQAANYQYCMEQISALVAEYQSWKNSLPTTQSQQFADAGINAAITGQGVSGSSVPNVGVATDPSTLQSTNVGEFIGNIVDKFLNVSSGTLDWISKFNEISLNKNRFQYDQDASFAAFKYQLSKDGVEISPDVHSFIDLINSGDTEWYDNASYRAKRLYNEFLEIRSMDSYGHTIIDRTLKGDYRSGNFFTGGNDTSITRYGSYYGASIDISEYSKNISDLQYDLWLKDLEYRAEYAREKKKWHDENGYTNAEDIQLFDSEIKASDKLIRKYEREKMEIYVDYIKKLKSESDAGNLSSRVQLMDVLYDLSTSSVLADFGDELASTLREALN